jgi:hypothetical protein
VEQLGTGLREVSEAAADLFRDLDVVGVPRGGPRDLVCKALGDFVQGELRGAIHLGVQRALAVVASHYEIDLERVCDGYVLPDEPELAAAEAQRSNDAVEGPGTLLARHFEVEVLPPPPSPAAAEPPAGPPPAA